MDVLTFKHEGTGFHPNPESPGSYLDMDGFNPLDVVVVEDGMGDRLVATVLFAGTPVVTVMCTMSGTDTAERAAIGSSVDITYDLPMLTDNSHQQSQAAWGVHIGELPEEAPAWVADGHNLDTIYDDEELGPKCGDGHPTCEFVDVIGEALIRYRERLRQGG
jgi:hypothetical protein